MKKILVALLVFTLAFSAVGCSIDSDVPFELPVSSEQLDTIIGTAVAVTDELGSIEVKYTALESTLGAIAEVGVGIAQSVMGIVETAATLAPNIEIVAE